MKFKELLDKAYKEFKTTKTNVVFQYTKPIDISIQSILDRKEIKKNMFYMNLPDNNTYLGIGKTLSYKVSSKSGINNLIKKKHTTISNKSQILRFFGGLAFNLNNKSSYPWNNIPRGEFYIPKILIEENKNEINFTYSRIINKSVQKKTIKNDYKKILSTFDNNIFINNKKPTIKFESESPNKKNYTKYINQLINEIKDKKIEKVVISRLVKYSLKSKLHIGKLIQYFNEEYPKCFNFFICFSKQTIFTGSTPERLINLEGRSFIVDAIAGSSKTTNELKNIKEIDEHNHVIHHIYKTMSKISSKLNKQEKPEILNLKYIKHLSTIISGTLKNDTHILNILSDLYPTPAMLGNNSKKALKYIEKTEKTDRGWYSGAIGIYDENGEGDFYVPIRSGIIKEKLLLLFTGSGIVSKSSANKEWDETVLKLNHILSYFKKTNLK